MAKHKRVLHDSTPVGLPRWLRAADNAVRNPNSPGAKLYYRRVANAQRIREKYGDGGPVVFFKEHYSYTVVDGRYVSNHSVTDKRDVIACSNFCAAVHTQKRYMTEFRSVQEGTKTERGREYPNYVRYEVPVTFEELEDFLQTDERNNLLELTDIKLKRPVRCIVCWTPVKN